MPALPGGNFPTLGKADQAGQRQSDPDSEGLSVSLHHLQAHLSALSGRGHACPADGADEATGGDLLFVRAELSQAGIDLVCLWGELEPDERLAGYTGWSGTGQKAEEMVPCPSGGSG